MKTLFFRLATTAIVATQLVASTCSAGIFDFNNENTHIPYCDDANECGLDEWTNAVKANLNDIQTEMTFSAYIQQIVGYFLGFLALIAVLFIIYAGFQMLTAQSDSKKVDEAKGTIKNALMGLLVIFLAYSIVAWFINILNLGKTSFAPPSMVESAYAVNRSEANTFADFKERILLLTAEMEKQYKVNDKISDGTLTQLTSLVTKAFATLPDEENIVYNTNLYKTTIASIDVLKKKASQTALIKLATDLNNFLEKTKILRIKGGIAATPKTGNAPLTVTLRSENMVDPSGVIIPKANYVWWMKGSNGKEVIIGNGPSISYKFLEEKNYTVYLSVSSASRNKNGYADVLPFNSSIVIDVQGKVANVRLYMNGIDMSYDDTYKVHPSDARAGIIIDATPSFASDGYQFTYTSWDFGNGNTSSYNGAPKLERQTYSNEGTYTLKLKVTNNEGKHMEKTLTIVVRDPIASIIRDKDEGYVGDDFRFSPGNFFQKSDKIAYKWEVLNLETGKGIYESSLQNITYKFLKVGKYAVRLTTTAPNGEKDIESVRISIESRNPIAVFESKAVSQETPNVYYFDGSRSYDPDTYENSTLEFKWYIDGKEAKLSDPVQNGSIGYYTFSSLGNHKVTLEVTNQDLKKGTFSRDITINSLLSVKMRTPTKISYVGKAVTFLVDSSEASTYEWVFGDGETDVGNQPRITHTYKKSGTFDVTLTVRGKSGVESNTITRKVFIKGGDEPMAYISVKRDSDGLIPVQDACNGREAYVVDRAKAITFSADDSINTDGSTQGLSYAWTFGGRTSSQRSFSYKFDELGCFPVTLMVRSQKTGRTNTQTLYVRADNLPPKISGLAVVADNLDKDPVVVSVTANNAIDEDGVVVSYLWYYYTEGNPEPQDVRITKNPKTTFVLPRVSNKYYFVLIAEDSNGDKTNTDEFFQEKYSLQILSDNTNTPLITLKPDKRSAGVGEDITYTATVKNVLGNDITNKVEYKWDFDGDGFYDKTTTEATAQYRYDKPGEFHVKLKANYKGISNTRSETVLIQNALTPDFATIGVGEKIAFVNTSKGVYKKAIWKMGSKTISEKLESFVYDFSDADLPQDITLEISDGSDTKSITLPVKKDIINVKQIAKKDDALIYLTYPRAKNDEVHLDTATDKLFVYLGESRGSGSVSAYVIDTDADVDTDLNGGVDDDSDNKGTDSYYKGSPYKVPTDTMKKREFTLRMALADKSGKTIAYKNLKVFLDYISETAQDTTVATGTLDATITTAEKVIFQKIEGLILEVPQKEQSSFKKYLSAIQENWGDTREKTRAIIDFESFVQSSATLTQSQKDTFYDAIESFLLADSKQKDDVALAVKVVESLVSKTHPQYALISGNLKKIAENPTNTAENKKLATAILEAIKNDTTLSAADKATIKSQLLFLINGKTGTTTTTPSSGSADSGGILSFLASILKIFGILLLVFFGLVGLLFAYYQLVADKTRYHTFQDYFIDTFINGGALQKKNPVEQTVATKKDDILAQITAEEPKEKAVEAVEETANTSVPPLSSEPIPDWMKPADNKYAAFNPEETESSSPTPADFEKETDGLAPADSVPVGEETIPDWLKGVTSLEVPEETAKEVVQEEVKEELPEEVASSAEDLPQEDLPSWLSSEAKEEVLQEVQEELETPVASSIETPTSEPAQAVEDSFPDWLKGVAMSEPVAEEAKESPVEEKEIQEEEKAEVATAPQETAEELPSWLVSEPEETPAPVLMADEDTSAATPAPEAVVNDDNVPDWLKAFALDSNKEEPAQAQEEVAVVPETEETVAPAKQKKTKATPVEVEEEAQVEPAPKAEAPTEQKKTPEKKAVNKKKPFDTEKKKPSSLAANDKDLPDWLK